MCVEVGGDAGPVQCDVKEIQLIKAVTFATMCAAERTKDKKKGVGGTMVIKVTKAGRKRNKGKSKQGGAAGAGGGGQAGKAVVQVSEARAAAEKALAHWEACIDFAVKLCPPSDESIVCYATHATLSALALEDAGAEAAAKHMQLATATHAIAFGPGADYFKARYETEVFLSPLGPEFGARYWELAAAVMATDTQPTADPDTDMTPSSIFTADTDMSDT
jgi:hypothetical protein